MDMPAIVSPVPVQPAEASQAAPSAQAPDEASTQDNGFAAALEQQITQAAPRGAGGTHARSAAANPLDASDDDPKAAHDAATPDGLLALIANPLMLAHAPVPATPAEPHTGSGREVGAAVPDKAGRATDALRAEPRGQSAAAAPAKTPDAFSAADALRSAHAPAEEHAHAPVVPGQADALAAAPQALPPLPAPAAVAPAAAAVDDRQIAPRVGSAGWSDGLAQQVTLMVKDGEQTAQLRLDPPDLGPLEVRLSMTDQDKVAHAQFVSPHAAVRDALEAALPQLRAVLADSGITLGQASVGEGFVREDPRQPQHSGSASHGQRAGAGSDGPAAIGAVRTVVRHGLVDTFA